MNILPISEIEKREPAFTAGKTKILSDFDGTFIPKEYYGSICYKYTPCGDKSSFCQYFDEFDKFLKEENDDGKRNELTIATGRNLSEFNTCMREIKSKGLLIPIPKRLITVNGGDEFLSNNNSDYFSSNKRNMFEKSDKNLDEQNKLSKFFISYDPKTVLEKVKKFLSDLKETKEKNGQKIHSSTNSVSMKKDSEYLISLIANSRPVVDELRRLPDILEDEGYAIYTDIKPFYKKYTVPPKGKLDNRSLDYGATVCMKPMTKGKVKILDKYHHAKIMADEITKNSSNDLVIVAGDGINDIQMLNLSNYSDSMKSYTDFSKPEFRIEAEKIPVRAIFIRNSDSLDYITREFEKNFNFDGQKRFIIVDKNDPKRPNTLLEAIKLAKKDYAQVNPQYKANM